MPNVKDNLSYQDQSHGLPELYRDWNDAAIFAQSVYDPNDIGYVVSGLELQPDFQQDTVTVTGGWAKVYKAENHTLDHVDDQGVGQESRTLLDAMHPAQSETEELILNAGDTNYIWLTANLSKGNEVDIISDTKDQPPDLPHVKLGKVDTANETYNQINRLPDAEYNDLKAKSASVEQSPSNNTDVFRLGDYVPTRVSDNGTQKQKDVSDINFGENISVSDTKGGKVRVETPDNTIQTSVEAASNPLDIDISGDAETLDGTTEAAFAKLAQSETVTGDWSFKPKPYFNSGIELDVEEGGLTIDESVDYFGSPHSAARFQLNDTSTNYDAGFLFEYATSGSSKELLTIRDSQYSDNFHYEENEIWHAGNFTPSDYYKKNDADNRFINESDEGKLSVSYADNAGKLDGTSEGEFAKRSQNETITGSWDFNGQTSIEEYSFSNKQFKGHGDGRVVTTEVDNNGNPQRLLINEGSDYSTVNIEGSVSINGNNAWHSGNFKPSDYYTKNDANKVFINESDESNLSVAQAENADKLDGTHEGAFAKLAQNETVTGYWDFSDFEVSKNGYGTKIAMGGSQEEMFIMAPMDGKGNFLYPKEIQFDPDSLQWDIGGQPRAGGNRILTTADNLKVDVSEDGSQVQANVEDINFGNNTNVSDNGNGSVTVNSIDTDTHTDVSDGNQNVVNSVKDINFGDNLDAREDGNGTVTVDGSDIQTDTQVDVSDNGTTVIAQTQDINFGSNIGVTNNGNQTVTVETSDNTIQNSVEAANNPLNIDISGDAETLDGTSEGEFAKLSQAETVTNTWTFIDQPFFRSGIKVDSDEGEFTLDKAENYFGSPHSATQFRMHDTTGNHDAGFVFDYENGNGNVEELLTLRTEGFNNGFQYQGHDIWHAGNDGAGSGLDADKLDGAHAVDFGKLAQNETVTGQWTFDGNVHMSSGTITGIPTPSGPEQAVPRDWANNQFINESDESNLRVQHAQQAENADKLDGTHEAAFAKRAQDERISGSWSFEGGVEFGQGNSGFSVGATNKDRPWIAPVIDGSPKYNKELTFDSSTDDWVIESGLNVEETLDVTSDIVVNGNAFVHQFLAKGNAFFDQSISLLNGDNIYGAGTANVEKLDATTGNTIHTAAHLDMNNHDITQADRVETNTVRATGTSNLNIIETNQVRSDKSGDNRLRLDNSLIEGDLAVQDDIYLSNNDIRGVGNLHVDNIQQNAASEIDIYGDVNLNNNRLRGVTRVEPTGGGGGNSVRIDGQIDLQESPGVIHFGDPRAHSNVEPDTLYRGHDGHLHYSHFGGHTQIT